MNEKVAILGVADLRHMTMISLYTDYLVSQEIEYEVICSTRYKDETLPDNVHAIPMMGNSVPKFIKLFYFIKFRENVISYLKQKKYNFIIVWGENTAVLFEDYLRKMKAGYCVNIRDSDFSKMPGYFKRLSKAVSQSSFSTWCAQRGLDILPKHDYVIVLNQNLNLLQNTPKRTGFRKREEKVRICTIGAVRYVDESIELLTAFANDDRFLLQFHGNNYELLEEFANKHGIMNVIFTGTFPPEKTGQLLEQADVINVYCGDGNKDRNITLGSPIRFGYATWLYMPTLISPNTRLAEKTTELNIGYVVTQMNGLADSFYEWYHSLEFEQFRAGCDEYNKEFDDSKRKFYDKCKQFIN